MKTQIKTRPATLGGNYNWYDLYILTDGRWQFESAWTDEAKASSEARFFQSCEN